MVAKLNILTYPHRIAKSRIRVHTVIEGDPPTKRRARFNSKTGIVYTPRETREAQELIGWAVKSSHQGLMPDADSAFGVRVLFYAKGFVKKDIDNMAKVVLDACTGIVWQDDKQVVELLARFFKNDALPRTEMCIYTLGFNENGVTSTCVICGKVFAIYRSTSRKLYCSRECMRLGFRQGKMRPCVHCGAMVYRAPFREATQVFCSRQCMHQYGTEQLACSQCGKTFPRPKSLNRGGARKFCSSACVVAFHRSHPAKNGQGQCEKCGAPTGKKAVKQCRACYIANRYHLN